MSLFDTEANALVSMDDEANDRGWLVTFADSMSLLLTFFVLLISYSSFEKVDASLMVDSVSAHLGGGNTEGNSFSKANYIDHQLRGVISDNVIGIQLSEETRAELLEELAGEVVEVDLEAAFQKKILTAAITNNPDMLYLLLEKSRDTILGGVVPEKKGTYIDVPHMRFRLKVAELKSKIVFSAHENSIDVFEFKKESVLFLLKIEDFFDEENKLKSSAVPLFDYLAKIVSEAPNPITIECYAGVSLGDVDAKVLNRQMFYARRLMTLLKNYDSKIQDSKLSLCLRGRTDAQVAALSKGRESLHEWIGITVESHGDISE